MPDFRSNLLREKFVIKATQDTDDSKEPVVALSNRMVLPLISEDGKEMETFIVRAQNMHSCVRFAAAVAKEFYENGAIMGRETPLAWDGLWQEVIKGFEKEWNPKIWGCVYCKGKLLFSDGEHHPFLDVIEQCDAKAGSGYEKSLGIAEDAFMQAGREVSIEHDANVALVTSMSDVQAKCGLIIRSPNQTTTFNFTAKPLNTKREKLRIASILTVCAGFLEGVQLAFLAGMANRKRSYDLIERGSDEARKGDRATERLRNLNKAIKTFEMKYDINYRPERPNFMKLVDDAEQFAMTVLKSQIEDMIRSGELDKGDWVT